MISAYPTPGAVISLRSATWEVLSTSILKRGFREVQLMGSKYPSRKNHGYCYKLWFRTGPDEVRRRLRADDGIPIFATKLTIRKHRRPRIV